MIFARIYSPPSQSDNTTPSGDNLPGDIESGPLTSDFAGVENVSQGVGIPPSAVKYENEKKVNSNPELDCSIPSLLTPPAV